MTKSQPIIIAYETALLKKSVNRAWKRVLPCLVLTVSLWEVSALIATAISWPFLQGFAAGALLIYVLTIIKQYKQQKKNTLNAFNQLASEITINEQGYTVNTQITYVWSEMKTVLRYPDCWYIYLKNNLFLILPLHHFSLEAQAEILEKAQAAGCKIK